MMEEFKKSAQISPVNKKVINTLDRYNHRIDFVLADDTEIDG